MRPVDVEPLKDPHNAHPIAESWRPILRRVVQAFARSDFELATTLPLVAPVSPSTAKQIRDYVADYGETLIDLPEETWETSMAQWMKTHWEILVDLWTAESGRSDMVLAVRVFEVDSEYRFEVDSVYVP
jgi:hypothetical protein